jgi:hypothetical protein
MESATAEVLRLMAPPPSTGAPVGSLYTMYLAKLKLLLASVAIHEPFAAAAEQAQHVAWRRVHNDVWQNWKGAFDVQFQFTRLMAIPENYQSAQRGWDAEMCQLHSQVLHAYGRAKQVMTEAAGSDDDHQTTSESASEEHRAQDFSIETEDNGAADEESAPPDTSAVTSYTRAAVPMQVDVGPRPPAFVAEGNLRQSKRPRRCGNVRAATRATKAQTAVSKEGEPSPPASDGIVVGFDPIQDLKLARAVVKFKPHHAKPRSAVWAQISKVLQIQQYRRNTTARALAWQFGVLLKYLCDPTTAGQHKEIRNLLGPYCKSLENPTLAMAEFVGVLDGESLLLSGRALRSAGGGQGTRTERKKASRLETTPSVTTSTTSAVTAVTRAEAAAAPLTVSTASAPSVATTVAAQAIDALSARDDRIHTEFMMLREEFGRLANYRKQCEDSYALATFFATG